MSNRAWMPLHIDDYIRDTDHLSATEHGAYLLLIMKYWRDGRLPSDEGLIRRYAKLSPDQWAESRAVLADLFEDGWRHKRIDAELSKADEIIEKRRSAAKGRHEKNRSTANAEQVHVTGDAKAVHMHDRGNASALQMHSTSTSICSDTGVPPRTSNQDSYSTPARAGDATARIPEMLQALGITDETKSPGLLSYEPLRWVEGGCDVDLDILPALRSIAARGGKPVRSWAYCEQAVIEHRDRRLAPMPEPSNVKPATSRPIPSNPGTRALSRLKNGAQHEHSSQSHKSLDQGDGGGEGEGVSRIFRHAGPTIDI